MRIEEVTKKTLKEVDDKNLLMLRLRFLQVWNKNFKDNIEKTVVGSLNRGELITKYRMLLKELQTRSLQHSTEDIDRQAFKKAMEVAKQGVDLDQFEFIADKTNYVLVERKGDFKEVEKINIIIQDEEENRNEFLEEEIVNFFKEQMEKECVFIYTKNFSGLAMPLFHRILQPAKKVEKLEIVNDVEEQEEPKLEKKFEENIPIIPIVKGDEHIVYGIVYEPDTTDAQGDAASVKEIQKAAYQFMEEVQVFKVNHKGKEVAVRVLENYLAPVSFSIGKKKVKKGSWVLVTRILDKAIWKAIKDKTLTGYSMAGYATV